MNQHQAGSEKPISLSSAAVQAVHGIVRLKRFSALSLQAGAPFKSPPRYGWECLLSRTGGIHKTYIPIPTPLITSEILLFRAAAYPLSPEISSFTPGPIVDEMLAFFKYVPLTPEGLALTIASTKAVTFSWSASSLKLALPTPA